MAAENSQQENPPVSVPGPSLVTAPAKRKIGWGRRVELLVLALFCLEVGGFLLIFPWVPQWNDNYFFTVAENMRPLFLSPYFRGGVSGLGVLNLYLAVIESVEFLSSFVDS